MHEGRWYRSCPSLETWRKPVHMFVLLQCVWFIRRKHTCARSIATSHRMRRQVLRRTQFHGDLRHAREKSATQAQKVRKIARSAQLEAFFAAVLHAQAILQNAFDGSGGSPLTWIAETIVRRSRLPALRLRASRHFVQGQSRTSFGARSRRTDDGRERRRMRWLRRARTPPTRCPPPRQLPSNCPQLAHRKRPITRGRCPTTHRPRSRAPMQPN